MATIFESALRTLREFGLWAEAWFIPPACIHCGGRRFGSGPLCFRCLRVLLEGAGKDFLPEGDGIRALYRLSPPLQSLIHGFKYRRFRKHIRFLCSELRRRPALIKALGKSDGIVPVPLHPARRRERGYNQAELISREIARRCGLPVLPGALFRIRPTTSQTRLGEEERARNLAGAFRAVSEMVSGKRILLVDDVYTTGSTLRHCRDELLRAGATEVGAFALAWVKRHYPRESGADSKKPS